MRRNTTYLPRDSRDTICHGESAAVQPEPGSETAAAFVDVECADSETTESNPVFSMFDADAPAYVHDALQYFKLIEGGGVMFADLVEHWQLFEADRAYPTGQVSPPLPFLAVPVAHKLAEAGPTTLYEAASS